MNAVFTNLCDVDPIFGAPEQMPEYHTEAAVFVPHDHIIDLPQQVNNPQRIEQLLPPLLQGTYYLNLLLNFQLSFELNNNIFIIQKQKSLTLVFGKLVIIMQNAQ